MIDMATIVSEGWGRFNSYKRIFSTEDVSIAKAIAKAVRGPSGGFQQ